MTRATLVPVANSSSCTVSSRLLWFKRVSQLPHQRQRGASQQPSAGSHAERLHGTQAFCRGGWTVMVCGAWSQPHHCGNLMARAQTVWVHRNCACTDHVCAKITTHTLSMISQLPNLTKKVVRRRCRFSHEELVGAYVTKQDDGSYHTQNLQRKTSKTW